MSQAKAKTTLSDFDRHSLYEACSREAQRLGGDERTAEYFFLRAQSSRVWLSNQGKATIADMDISDWCGAIAWSAPNVGRPPRRTQQARTGRRAAKASATKPSDQPNGSPPQSSSQSFRESAEATQAKKPRSGAKARRGE